MRTPDTTDSNGTEVLMDAHTGDAHTPRIPPFCLHLSSQKVLGRDRPPMTAADVLDGSRSCWCTATSQLLGPDREPAHPDACLKHRECFESAFADLA